MLARSTAHLKMAGESYVEHFRFASTVGLMAIAAGLACLIHAIVPALCTGTASRTIRHLNNLLDERDRVSEVRAEASEVIAFVLLTGVAALVVLPLWLTSAPPALRIAYTALAFAIPATFLLTNRELAVEQQA